MRFHLLHRPCEMMAYFIRVDPAPSEQIFAIGCKLLGLDPVRAFDDGLLSAHACLGRNIACKRVP